MNEFENFKGLSKAEIKENNNKITNLSSSSIGNHSSHTKAKCKKSMT